MKGSDAIRAVSGTAPAPARPGAGLRGNGDSSDWVRAGPLLAGLRRVCVFVGGFGSGKSEVAVNFAAGLAALGRRVQLADLDIVNPYFRSREARAALRALGVDLLLPAEGLMNADMPVVPPEVRGALESGGQMLVLDLGGDPVGARVLPSIAAGLAADELDGMFVLNSRRPFTSTAADAVQMLRDIERASGLRLNRVVVNSHLIDETDAGVVREGIALARDVCARTGATIAFVAVTRELLDRLGPAVSDYPLLVLDRQLLKPWERKGLKE